MASLALPTVDANLELSGLNYTLVIVVGVIALIALVMGIVFRQQVLANDAGTESMQKIAGAVEEGAQAYLNRQFKTLGIFAEQVTTSSVTEDMIPEPGSPPIGVTTAGGWVRATA